MYRPGPRSNVRKKSVQDDIVEIVVEDGLGAGKLVRSVQRNVAEVDAGIRHRTGQILQVLLLGLYEPVDSIERDTAVITDDTASGIVVRKTCKESQLSEFQYLISIYIEYSVIM